MKNFKFGTKSENLDQLNNNLINSKIPNFIYFNLKNWKNNKKEILNQINKSFKKVPLVVRSSGIDEDKSSSSLAGKYLSLLNVKNEKKEIIIAINKVFKSYGVTNFNNQIIIQKQLKKVYISGVLFTRDLNDGSRYYTITYDDKSGLTNTVTSGLKAKSIIIFHKSLNQLKSQRFKKLIKAIKEIEKKTNSNFLDIEFCIDNLERIFILQVRPLAVESIKKNNDFIYNKINSTKKKIRDNSIKNINLLGNYSIYSDMADWNPSEMIGNHPRILSQDLYKKLITKYNWSKARDFLGYKSINNDLMIIFQNKPYIDIRLSLISFIPKNLKKNLSNKIINIQLKLIKLNSRLHNKIESEVCIPSLDLSFDHKIKKYIKFGLKSKEIYLFKRELKNLTMKILFDENKSIKNIFKQTNKLNIKRKNYKSDKDYMRDLIKRCSYFGTYQFSIIARHAFIGTELLKSLLFKKLISIKDYENFHSSIETITSLTLNEYKKIKNKNDEKIFLRNYGHLRPGTYDIMSKRYDEAKEIYFNNKSKKIKTKKVFKLSLLKEKKINYELKKIGFKNFKTYELFEYIKLGIVYREKTKFEFSKNISEFLKFAHKLGVKKGFTRKELSFFKINEIIKINDLSVEKILKLKELIKKRENKFYKSKFIKLPDVIIKPADIEVIRVPIDKPTFITNKIIRGKITIIKKISKANLDNLVVLIDFADPGYDWIFMYKIRGLITKFGNPNSHMSIRCSELNIPAAIGCGQRLYDFIKQNSVVEINCYEKKINCIKE